MIAIKCNSLAASYQSKELLTLPGTNTTLALPVYPVPSAMTSFWGRYYACSLRNGVSSLFPHFCLELSQFSRTWVKQTEGVEGKTSEGVLTDSCVSRTATHVSVDSTAEKAAICQKFKSHWPGLLTRIINFLHYLSALTSKILSLC